MHVDFPNAFFVYTFYLLGRGGIYISILIFLVNVDLTFKKENNILCIAYILFFRVGGGLYLYIYIVILK